MFETKNPGINKKIKSFSVLSTPEIKQKLDTAQDVFYNYLHQTSVEERSLWAKKIAADLNEHKQTYADLITLEMGKPIKQAIAEIEKCAWLCEFFAEHAPGFLADKMIETSYQKSYVHYQPLGAVMGIMPWNFPFWQAFRFFIPAMLAGNATLLKPAPNVPQCGMTIENIVEHATGKAGVFQTIFIDTEQVENVIQHPILRGVALTGSDRAGASVAALAGKHIKKCVLELGGSDAFIVLDDADLEQAAEIGVKARLNNNGQTCIAAKRFIVHQAVADQFLGLLKEKLFEIKIGEATDETTDLSTLARPDLLDNLERQVRKSIDKGAKILLDGGRMDRNGNYFSPMILGDLKPGMPAHDEELFGPVFSFFKAKDEAEAIQIANNSAYGLGAAVWSKNTDRAEQMARQLEAGAVFVNDFVKSDPRLPFGGVKRSGFGRELAEEGIREFVNIQSIVVH